MAELRFSGPGGAPLNPSDPRGAERLSPGQAQRELGQALFGRFAPVATAAADLFTPATPLGTLSQTMTPVDPALALGGSAVGLGLGALGMARGRGPRGSELNRFLQQVSEADVQRMMKTARSAGAIGAKPSLVTRAAIERIDPGQRVLDFGAGPAARQTQLLREAGFGNVTATDLPESIERSAGALRALGPDEVFDTVLASNVANVQPDVPALRSLMQQIVERVDAGGGAIVNFPNSPRPNNLRGRAFTELAGEFFDDVERVGGSADAPVLALRGPRQQPRPPTEFSADAFKGTK